MRSPTVPDQTKDETKFYSLLKQIASPLNEMEVAALGEQMEQGWRPFGDAGLRFQRSVSGGNRPMFASTSTGGVVTDKVTTLVQFIERVLQDDPKVSIRALADRAIDQFLSLPCSNRSREEFLVVYTQAYSQVLRNHARPSETPTATLHDALTLQAAIERPADTLKLLDRIEVIRKQYNMNVALWEMAHFAGSSFSEIARIRSISEQDAEAIIESVDFAVHRAD